MFSTNLFGFALETAGGRGSAGRIFGVLAVAGRLAAMAAGSGLAATLSHEFAALRLGLAALLATLLVEEEETGQHGKVQHHDRTEGRNSERGEEQFVPGEFKRKEIR